MSETPNKIVLAYSGGLDTSIILTWLRETYGCEIVAFCADLGQREELEPARKKAIALGAAEVRVEDLREEFVRDFVFPILRANAVYEGTYLLGTSIARPLIAKRQIEIARETGADAVSHGATGKGNDQVRFELTYFALEPEINIIAPWRIWNMAGRDDLVKYAQAHDIPVPAEKPYSCDRNIVHLSFEGKNLEDPWVEPPDDTYLLAVKPEEAPDEPAYVEIGYEAGNPVSVDGKPLGPVELIETLNELAGKHGVGRVDMVENRYVGIKCRGVYETPGVTLLHAAHRAVESITLDREVMHVRDSLISRYAELIYYGYWFAPEREVLQAAVDEAQKGVTGTARLKLYKGSVLVVGRKSPVTLYKADLASFEGPGGYQQSDAGAFIKLNALRLRVRARQARQQSDEER